MENFYYEKPGKMGAQFCIVSDGEWSPAEVITKKGAPEIQLMASHELNQRSSLNVAFWTLSKATEIRKAENYNNKNKPRE